MAKIIINKEELRNLILDDISTEELNSKYDYSHITGMGYLLADCNHLINIPELDTSNVRCMKYMFKNCYELEYVPLLDTSKVTNMRGMFSGCTNLYEAPLMNTCNVINMKYMFSKCRALISVPPFNTINVTKMKRMFNGCLSLSDVPNLDTSSIISIKDIFFNCPTLAEDIKLNFKSTNFSTRNNYLFDDINKISILDHDVVDAPYSFPDKKMFKAVRSFIKRLILNKCNKKIFVSLSEEGEIVFYIDDGNVILDLGFYDSEYYGYYAEDTQGNIFEDEDVKISDPIPKDLINLLSA